MAQTTDTLKRNYLHIDPQEIQSTDLQIYCIKNFFRVFYLLDSWKHARLSLYATMYYSQNSCSVGSNAFFMSVCINVHIPALF